MSLKESNLIGKLYPYPANLFRARNPARNEVKTAPPSSLIPVKNAEKVRVFKLVESLRIANFVSNIKKFKRIH